MLTLASMTSVPRNLLNDVRNIPLFLWLYHSDLGDKFTYTQSVILHWQWSNPSASEGIETFWIKYVDIKPKQTTTNHTIHLHTHCDILNTAWHNLAEQLGQNQLLWLDTCQFFSFFLLIMGMITAMVSTWFWPSADPMPVCRTEGTVRGRLGVSIIYMTARTVHACRTGSVSPTSQGHRNKKSIKVNFLLGYSSVFSRQLNLHNTAIVNTK